MSLFSFSVVSRKKGPLVTLQIAQQSNNLVETSDLAIAKKKGTFLIHEQGRIHRAIMPHLSSPLPKALLCHEGREVLSASCHDICI